MEIDYLIVGGGQAGRRAAETLREHAPDARICLIGDEPHPPYDRPVLSKAALLSPPAEDLAFIRDAAYYREQRIELLLGRRAIGVDRESKAVWLDDGQHLRYGRLLLATGSRPRRLSTPVNGDADVHYLRTLADMRKLRNALRAGASVVILGGGFIGLELAASAVSYGCEVTVIEPADALLKRSMPALVSDHIRALHIANGVRIQLDTVPVSLRADASGRVTVHTNRGDRRADVVIAGIGAVPNVELARSAGLVVDNGIVVDERCRTADPDIFAAGDVTSHFNPLLGGYLRVESWQVAENQPVVAACNMLGGDLVYAELPWLWSDQFDCNLQTLGVFTGQGQLICRGDPITGTFSVLEIDSGSRLAAAATVNCGRDMTALRKLAISGKSLILQQLADTSTVLRGLL